MTNKPTLKEIVTSGSATFSFYRQGYLYFQVTVDGFIYEFPIEIKDLGGATVVSPCKAIILMRYIRKALEDNTFIKVV
jgi:hypothetical protein